MGFEQTGTTPNITRQFQVALYCYWCHRRIWWLRRPRRVVLCAVTLGALSGSKRRASPRHVACSTPSRYLPSQIPKSWQYVVLIAMASSITTRMDDHHVLDRTVPVVGKLCLFSRSPDCSLLVLNSHSKTLLLLTNTVQLLLSEYT